MSLPTITPGETENPFFNPDIQEEEDQEPTSPEQSNSASSYLPEECLAAIEATNQKYDSMKEVWENYISNLRNGQNLVFLQHSLNHIQDITNEHLQKHSILKKNL